MPSFTGFRTRQHPRCALDPKDQKNLDSRLTSARQSSLCSQHPECGSPDDSLSAILSAPAMGPVILIYHPHSSVGDFNTYPAYTCLPRLSCQGCTDIKYRNHTFFLQIQEPKRIDFIRDQ